MTVSHAMSTNTIAVAIITWSARNVAVRWNSFLPRWIAWSRKSDANTITLLLAIPSRFMEFARIAARKTPHGVWCKSLLSITGQQTKVLGAKSCRFLVRNAGLKFRTVLLSVPVVAGTRLSP